MKRLFALLVFVLVSALLSAPAAADGCGGTVEMSAAMSKRLSAMTYWEFSDLSMKDRRLVYSALDAKVKSRLWRDQLEIHLQREGLTDAQRDVLLEAIQFVKPATFATTKDRASRGYQSMLEQSKALEERAKKAFRFEDVRTIFAILGPEGAETVQYIPTAREPRASKSLDKVGVACGCSQGSDYCPDRYDCHPDRCDCIPDDCGFLLTHDCDGACHNHHSGD